MTITLTGEQEALLRSLGDDPLAELDEALRREAFRRDIDKARKSAAEGRTLTHDQVMARLRR